MVYFSFADTHAVSSTLVLPNITAEEGGKYQCVVDNGYPPIDMMNTVVDVQCKYDLVFIITSLHAHPRL